jgi:tetratricopeptide (TPR) repeat protein
MDLRAAFRNRTPPENRRELVTFLILFLLGFLPYVNTLFNNFVYDDSFQVVENPYAHSFKFLRQIFTTTVWSFQGAQGASNYFRPVMTFGYLLTYQIAGAIPFSFHLANLVLNGIAIGLVFYLLKLFSGERVSLIAAGLFALHPIHTESVAWIAGVTDLELTVFYLATFLLYLRLSNSDRIWRTRAAMCASFALALLSKEQAMTLPVVAMVFEHFYRVDRSFTTIREKFSRYGLLWAIAALYLGARTLILGGIAAIVLRPNLSWYETVLSAIALIGKYLGKLIWPAHLSAFYVFYPSHHLTDLDVLLGLAGLALCAALFSILWRREHLLSFAIVWIFLTLGPVLNARWMPASAFGERYLYLPSVGFCWLLGAGVVQLWQSHQTPVFRVLSRAVPVVLGIVALFWGVRTVARNRDWKSDDTLFRRVLETQKDASLIRNNLGVYSFVHGDFTSAEQEWLVALASGATNTFALGNMALLRQRQERYAESLDYSWRALREHPNYTNGHVDLAQTLALIGRAQEAEWQFRFATTISPLSTRAHNAYGKFLYEAGRLEDARAAYQRSVSVDATSEAYDHLGDIYRAWQDSPRAEQAYRRAVGIDPFDSHAHIGLGEVLESAGRPGDALHEYEAGIEMDPTDSAAKAALIRIRGNTPAKADSR